MSGGSTAGEPNVVTCVHGADMQGPCDQCLADNEPRPGDYTHLRPMRVKRGLTLRQVRDRTGGVVSDAYLSQLERNVGGRSNPSLRILTALADCYELPLSDVIGDNGAAAPEPKPDLAASTERLRAGMVPAIRATLGGMVELLDGDNAIALLARIEQTTARLRGVLVGLSPPPAGLGLDDVPPPPRTRTRRRRTAGRKAAAKVVQPAPAGE